MKSYIYYAIRHKESGELMPEVRRKGYTYWNPSKNLIPVTALGTPRLLDTRRRAAKCIIQWAVMPNAKMRYDDNGGEYLDITLDGRKKEDLEVVEVELRIEE